MPRLRSLPQRLRAAPPRVAVPDYAERDSNGTRPDRAWYKTARWQRLRERVIKRDGWVCQQTGVLLSGEHPAPDSPVVDHIVPHRGDPRLFWDESNLQTVAKAWHDSDKQRMERRGQA